MSPEAVAAHRREVEAWHRQRLERLRAPDGWLSLVGLWWLEEGEHRVGSHPSSEVLLPDTVPAQVGVLTRRGDALRLRVEEGVEAWAGGELVKERELQTDQQEGGPTVVSLGTVRFYAIARGERVGVRVKDEQAPTRTGFTTIPRFQVSHEWRRAARFEPYGPGRRVAVPNALGWATQEEAAGELVFQVKGEEHRLIALKGGDELFVVFGDRTNGDSTYGAGRFLYVKPPGADGSVTIDFNRAYNPPCAFTPYATCPLPMEENRLPWAVEAGEKVPAR